MTEGGLDLDPAIDWLTMSQAAEILQINPSQVRRDRAVLNELSLINYQPRCKGIDRTTLEVLWLFRKLVKQRGRTKAIAKIITMGIEHER